MLIHNLLELLSHSLCILKVQCLRLFYLSEKGFFLRISNCRCGSLLWRMPLSDLIFWVIPFANTLPPTHTKQVRISLCIYLLMLIIGLKIYQKGLKKG